MLITEPTVKNIAFINEKLLIRLICIRIETTTKKFICLYFFIRLNNWYNIAQNRIVLIVNYILFLTYLKLTLYRNYRMRSCNGIVH